MGVRGNHPSRRPLRVNRTTPRCREPLPQFDQEARRVVHWICTSVHNYYSIGDISDNLSPSAVSVILDDSSHDVIAHRRRASRPRRALCCGLSDIASPWYIGGSLGACLHAQVVHRALVYQRRPGNPAHMCGVGAGAARRRAAGHGTYRYATSGQLPRNLPRPSSASDAHGLYSASRLLAYDARVRTPFPWRVDLRCRSICVVCLRSCAWDSRPFAASKGREVPSSAECRTRRARPSNLRAVDIHRERPCLPS